MKMQQETEVSQSYLSTNISQGATVGAQSAYGDSIRYIVACFKRGEWPSKEAALQVVGFSSAKGFAKDIVAKITKYYSNSSTAGNIGASCSDPVVSDLLTKWTINAETAKVAAISGGRTLAETVTEQGLAVVLPVPTSVIKGTVKITSSLTENTVVRHNSAEQTTEDAIMAGTGVAMSLATAPLGFFAAIPANIIALWLLDEYIVNPSVKNYYNTKRSAEYLKLASNKDRSLEFDLIEDVIVIDGFREFDQFILWQKKVRDEFECFELISKIDSDSDDNQLESSAIYISL